MPTNDVFGLSIEWIILITIFWMIVAMVIFGVEALYDNFIMLIMIFLTLGTIFLVSHFGWQILILPSLAIIAGAAVIAWKFFST
jgi:hypothetical protein